MGKERREEGNVGEEVMVIKEKDVSRVVIYA